MAAGDLHPIRHRHQELSLVDIARRFEDGRLLPVVNALSQINECVEDFLLVEAKYPTGDQFSYETALQEGQWTAYGVGTHAERSDQDDKFETIGSLTGLSRLNFRTARASGDVMAVRNQEDMRYIKGMSHTIIGTVFYGNEIVNPVQFTGLAARYSDLDNPMVFGEGNTGADNSSIWLCQWDPEDGLCLLYPKGRADKGISIYNLGEGVATDYRNGGEYMVYRTFFEFEWGMAIKREDMIARVVNVKTDGSANGFDFDTLIDARTQLWMRNPRAGGVRQPRPDRPDREVRLQQVQRLAHRTEPLRPRPEHAPRHAREDGRATARHRSAGRVGAGRRLGEAHAVRPNRHVQHG